MRPRPGLSPVSRLTFNRHVLPLLVVFVLAGTLLLISLARRAFDSMDEDIERTCGAVGAQDREVCITALITAVQAESYSFEFRNDAVWVLGQLADPRALPALESVRTGLPCADPCRRDEALCQREVERAIQWCRKEPWLPGRLRRLFGSRWR